MARNRINATDNDRITLTIGEPGEDVPTYRIYVEGGRLQIMKLDGPDGCERMAIYPKASNVIEVE